MPLTSGVQILDSVNLQVGQSNLEQESPSWWPHGENPRATYILLCLYRKMEGPGEGCVCVYKTISKSLTTPVLKKNGSIYLNLSVQLLKEMSHLCVPLPSLSQSSDIKIYKSLHSKLNSGSRPGKRMGCWTLSEHLLCRGVDGRAFQKGSPSIDALGNLLGSTGWS